LSNPLGLIHGDAKKKGCNTCFPARGGPWGWGQGQWGQWGQWGPWGWGPVMFPQGAGAFPGVGPGCGPKRKCSRPFVTWKVRYLVSNRRNLAAHEDPALIGSWGIVVAEHELWVANNTTDSLTNYDIKGNKAHVTVNVRDSYHNAAFPNGLIVNRTSNFPVSNGFLTKPALLLTCTDHGTIHAFNPCVDPIHAPLVINHSFEGFRKVYKGLAMTKHHLYACDFFNRRIDVFNGIYEVQTGFPFIDCDATNPIPPDFAPFNIVHLGAYLYVLYARRDRAIPVLHITGPGTGYVSVFNLDGTFVRRLISCGELNAPWGLIPAPRECGFPKDAFLISNNGDGHINIYCCDGKHFGKLISQGGKPIHIEGLYGLAHRYKCENEIFFASSPDIGHEGIVGSLVVDQLVSC